MFIRPDDTQEINILLYRFLQTGCGLSETETSSGVLKSRTWMVCVPSPRLTITYCSSSCVSSPEYLGNRKA